MKVTFYLAFSWQFFSAFAIRHKSQVSVLNPIPASPPTDDYTLDHLVKEISSLQDAGQTLADAAAPSLTFSRSSKLDLNDASYELPYFDSDSDIEAAHLQVSSFIELASQTQASLSQPAFGMPVPGQSLGASPAQSMSAQPPNAVAAPMSGAANPSAVFNPALTNPSSTNIEEDHVKTLFPLSVAAQGNVSECACPVASFFEGDLQQACLFNGLKLTNFCKVHCSQQPLWKQHCPKAPRPGVLALLASIQSAIEWGTSYPIPGIHWQPNADDMLTPEQKELKMFSPDDSSKPGQTVSPDWPLVGSSRNVTLGGDVFEEVDEQVVVDGQEDNPNAVQATGDVEQDFQMMRDRARVLMESEAELQTLGDGPPPCAICILVLEAIKNEDITDLPSICVDIFYQSKKKPMYSACHQVLNALSAIGSNIKFWLQSGCYKFESYFHAKSWVLPCPSHVVCSEMRNLKNLRFCPVLPREDFGLSS